MGALSVLIAAKLEALGQSVAFIGLIDPPVFTELVEVVPEESWQDEFIGFFRQVTDRSELIVGLPAEIVDPMIDEQPLLEWLRAFVFGCQERLQRKGRKFQLTK